MIKSTAIDPSLIGDDNVYRHRGPARVFVTEAAAIAAIKTGEIAHGDVIVLICGGPKGAGMQEIYQITSALKQLPHCKHVAVLTDARFSGVSTGACIGHISPEALAGGPDRQSARRRPDRDCDRSRRSWPDRCNLVGEASGEFQRRRRRAPAGGTKPRADLAPHPALPDDTRLWAALVEASGGVWGGCVYDTEKIVAAFAKRN